MLLPQLSICPPCQDRLNKSKDGRGISSIAEECLFPVQELMRAQEKIPLLRHEEKQKLFPEEDQP